MIECTLREFTEYHSALPSYNCKKTRRGFYSHTVLPIQELGRKKWLIIVHIDLDYESFSSEDLSEEEIFYRCVEFLVACIACISVLKLARA